jgi:hypothetical protein
MPKLSNHTMHSSISLIYISPLHCFNQQQFVALFFVCIDYYYNGFFARKSRS